MGKSIEDGKNILFSKKINSIKLSISTFIAFYLNVFIVQEMQFNGIVPATHAQGCGLNHQHQKQSKGYLANVGVGG